MKVRPLILFLLAVLVVAALWTLWPRASRLIAGKDNSSATSAAQTAPAPATTGPVAEDFGKPSAASTNRLAYRLANTPKTIGELAGQGHAILLENAFVDTDVKFNLSIPKHLRAEGDAGAYIVQARGAIDPAFRAMLATAGGEIVSYIPNNAYLVQLSGAAANVLSANPRVQAVLPYEPYYKVQSSLLGLAVNEKPLPDGMFLTLGLFGKDAAKTIAQVEKLGGEILMQDRSAFGQLVRVRPPADWIALARLPGVQLVEPAHLRVAANDLSRVAVGVSANTVTNANYLNLYGSNVIVEVNDSGIDSTHPDFASARVTGEFFDSIIDTLGHGTHVAGSIAGNGSQSGTVLKTPSGSVTNANFRGKAPLARLHSLGFLGLNDTNFSVGDSRLQETPAGTNALISNNSWANGGDYEYDLSAAGFDAAARDALPRSTGPQPVLFVFAAGNDGSGNMAGAGGVADSINSPATAKNVITVGALEQFRNITNIVTALDGTSNAVWQALTDSRSQIAHYSGRGNVGVQTEGDAGRFKPDVIAPGTFVVSTRYAQWDQIAYYSPTNYHFNYNFSGQFVNTNFFASYSLPVPTNAIAIVLQVVANRLTTLPLPQVKFYFSTGGAIDPSVPGSFDFTLTTNKVSIPPDGPGGYLQTVVANGGVSFVIAAPTNFPVNFDLIEEIITTNDNGNYFEVLSNLNETLGPYYRYESGTSMAAPSVSGVLALMQDFFTNTLQRAPSPALLKAMLINGARVAGNYKFAVTNTINFQGWGLVNLSNSIPAALTNTLTATNLPMFFVDQSPTNALATGDNQTYLVTVPAASQALPLRITLAWTDPPGNPAAAIKLVNNLDLVVTNLSNGRVYYGNTFATSGNPPFSTSVNTNAPRDMVNNVENIYIAAPQGTNYAVAVIARNVNVNADTTSQTNIVQDYALVISSGEGSNSNGISVTAMPPVPTPAITPLVTYVPNTNGILFNQLAGGNAPLLSTNFVMFGTNSGFFSNSIVSLGQTNQWHFFVVTNTTSFTNAAFIVFLPNTQATPRQGVYSSFAQNYTRPEADLDLYVASESSLTNLDPMVVSNCVYGLNGDKTALSRNGTEFAAFTNSTLNQVYYIAVKCEDQMAGQFGFISVFSQEPFSFLNPDGSQTVNGLLLPANIPDGNNAHAGVGYVFGLALYPMDIEKVIVTNIITHDNFGDLLGALSHDGADAILNNHDALGAVFNQVFYYDDSGESTNDPGARVSDGPGTLRNFQGGHAMGLWILTEIDDAQNHVGTVTGFSLRIFPHKDLAKNLLSETVPPRSWFYGYIDVPVGYTNLTIVATNLTLPYTPPLQLYLNYNQQPDFSNYLARVELTNGVPPGNSISYGPPLVPGRYYVGLFNPDNVAHNVLIGARLIFDAAAATTVNYAAPGSVPLLDDAVTYASMFVTNTDLIQAFNIGLRVDHARISDLVFHLIGPDGTRYLLMENRGGTSTNGAGLTVITTNVINISAQGNSRPDTNYFNIGQYSGTFPISYDFFTVPDQMTVYYGTNVSAPYRIFDTGYTNGAGRFVVSFPPSGISANSTYLTVVMNQFGNTNGSQWTYTMGGVLTNYYYLTFTEDTNLTKTPIKFAATPYLPAFATNTVYFTNIIVQTNTTSFTNNSAISGFEPGLASNHVVNAFVSGWKVISNQVSVLTDTSNVHLGSNFLALADGVVSNTLPTTIGNRYTLTYATRGPGMVSMWRAENSTNDFMGVNTGTLTNSPTTNLVTFFAPGKVGQAFSFDGTVQYLRVPRSTSLNTFNNQLTIEFWMKADTNNLMNSFQGLVDTDHYGVEISNGFGGTVGVNFYVDTSAGSFLISSVNGGGIPISRGLWHHVAGVYDGKKIQLYFDGLPKGNSQTASGTVTSMLATSFLGIGSDDGRTYCGCGGRYFWGLIDEASVYNRGLSASEIRAIYTNGAAGKFDPVVSTPLNLAEGKVFISGVTNATVFGANTNWQTNSISFVAAQNGTPMRITGVEPGILMDSFSLQGIVISNQVVITTNIFTNVLTAVSPLDYQPEQSLSALIGTSAYGNWQLEILDNRAGATNATLLSWQLAFTFANTNIFPSTTVTNGNPTTNTLVAGSIEWFTIYVPTNADYSTNILLFATNLPVNVWFSTNFPPTTTNAAGGDVDLIPNSTGGSAVLGTNGSPANTTSAYLVPGGTYYLGVENTNGSSVTFALQVNFHLRPAAPTVITLSATNVLATSATLQGLVNPNGAAATAYFEYGLTTNYTFTSSSVLIAANLTNFNFFAIGISNLLPGAVYHFRAAATNSVGANFGADLTFTNLPLPPDVITTAASNITVTTATLDALVTPNGAPTTVYFAYGFTTNYELGFSTTLLLGNNLNLQQPVGIDVTNLVPNTLYHFQAIGTNIAGTNFGGDLTFMTPPAGAPFAFTEPGTLLNGSSAQLNGMATPNGVASAAWFEFGTSTGYGVTTPAVNVGSNYTVVFVTNQISGLVTNLPYHYRLVVSNVLGVAYGFDQLFDQANVVAWGANYVGQITVPGLTNLVVGIAAGYENSLALNNDGTVVVWGINTFGQTNVPPGLNSAVGIGGGDRQSLALRSNRTVRVWGSNQFGQTNVPPGLNNAVEAASGGVHCLALCDNGRVVAWGFNGSGQTNVPAGLTNVVAISGGELHSLALKNDGTVVGWGYNGDGEINVPAGLTNVVAISAGGYHNLALKKDGTVVAWGLDNDGQVSGSSILGGATNVIAIAAGGFHSLVLKSDGSVIGWGDNGSGQTTTPVGMSNVVAIAAGGLHSLALSSVYGLNQTNNAPFFPTNPPSLVMNELTVVTVTNQASDTNVPSQILSYSLMNPPAWATIDTQGVITLAPLEADGPAARTIDTVVRDNGYPSLTATNSFLVFINEVNVAPVLPGQTNYIINEMTLLTVTNTATDSDIPTNALTYLLSVSGGVTNAVISTNGIITWTPTEAQGPGTYTFTTIVTDFSPLAVNATSLTATNTFTVTVLEVNTAPQFILTPTNLTVAAGTTFTVTNLATDSDLQANILTYSLSNAPAGASIDANGVITLTLNPGTNLIITVVTDNGVPPLSASNQFVVIVTGTPPSVSTNISISGIVSTNIAGTNGFLLTWFAPSNNLFQVQFSDSLAPMIWTTFTNIISYNTNFPASSTNAQFNFFDDGALYPFGPTRFYRLLLLTNAAANTAPVFAPQATRFINPLALLTVTNAATDSDVPAQTLTYILVTPPSGAIMDTNTGVVTWTPTLAQSGTTNTMKTIVTDNGAPPLTATNSFDVVVNPVPTFTSALIVTNGVNLQWSALTNEQFQVQWATNLMPAITWFTFPDVLTSTNGLFTFTDTNAPLALKFYRLLLLP